MSTGTIHLRGEFHWEPKARTIFNEALQKFKADPKHKGYLLQLQFIVDLAEKDFMRTLRGVAEKKPELFAQHWEREAPDHAMITILNTLIAWNSSGRKQGKRRKR